MTTAEAIVLLALCFIPSVLTLAMFISRSMTIFTIFAAYGLRERRDTIAEAELERGEGDYIDETQEEIPGQESVSKRTKRIRGRADARRSKAGGEL